jgi:hypothetical protein
MEKVAVPTAREVQARRDRVRPEFGDPGVIAPHGLPSDKGGVRALLAPLDWRHLGSMG